MESSDLDVMLTTSSSPIECHSEQRESARLVPFLK